VGDYFKKHLEELNKGKVKGKGLMLGLEIEKPCKDLVIKGLEKGIVFNCTAGNVLRFLPPLVITEYEIDQAMEKLKEIL
jgi:acetylornithine/N-succinyldiaminopimelate aminotransferase